MDIEVVAVRRVDVLAHPDAGVGECDVARADRRRQRHRGVRGLLGREAMLECERGVAMGKPTLDERMVVVARDDHERLADERLAEPSKHRFGG